ncbi:hypothetical protein HDV00_006521 [Rhizophlyctis rosea]|nr:hypothetical protein HDV00_006521 [Rhizophlyctis rosea]
MKGPHKTWYSIPATDSAADAAKQDDFNDSFEQMGQQLEQMFGGGTGPMFFGPGMGGMFGGMAGGFGGGMFGGMGGGPSTPAPSTPAPSPSTPAATPVPENACAKCGSTPSTLQRCGRCKQVKYCGRECQAAHWKVHKRSCRTFAILVDAGVKPPWSAIT